MHTNNESHSFWQESVKPEPHSKVSNDLTCEICIVGAGIAGLSLAYELSAAGKEVVVLSDRPHWENETGRTSAHLSNALDDRFYQIEKMHGKQNAKLAASSHMDAIERIEHICKKEQIDCEFKRITGYLFSQNNQLSEITKEHDAARRAGIKVTYEVHPILGKCLVFPDQARFHPLKYLHGLVKCIEKQGGKIDVNAQVNNVNFQKLELTLANGKKIKAKKLIFATNSPFMTNLSLLFKLDPQRTYVIGLKIPKNAVEDALFWDNADPYHYVRIENLNDTADLLIVGGEDHRVGFKPMHDPFKALITWTKQHFDLNKIDLLYQWSGQILEPVDYLAYIGKHPKNPNAFMVTGDSGNGLTHGVIASQIISDTILHKKNAYAALYKVKRLPIRAIKNLLSNMSASMIAYLKYLIPQWTKMPKKGQGKIVQRGFKKTAVYKDEHNKLHKCSGICPHLGGVLSWNAIEKTWDCGAHGSRFDLGGNRLNGPATTDLKCPLQKN